MLFGEPIDSAFTNWNAQNWWWWVCMQSSCCDERFGVSQNRTPNTNKFFSIDQAKGQFSSQFTSFHLWWITWPCLRVWHYLHDINWRFYFFLVTRNCEFEKCSKSWRLCQKDFWKTSKISKFWIWTCQFGILRILSN